MCADNDNDNDYDVAYANEDDDDGDTGIAQKKKGQVSSNKKRQAPSKGGDKRKPSVNVNKYARNKGKIPVNEHKRRPPQKPVHEEGPDQDDDINDDEPVDDEENEQLQEGEEEEEEEEEQFSGGEDADDEQEGGGDEGDDDEEQDNRASKRYQRQQIAKAKNRPPPMTVQEFLKLDMNEMEREINDRQVRRERDRISVFFHSSDRSAIATHAPLETRLPSLNEMRALRETELLVVVTESRNLRPERRHAT